MFLRKSKSHNKIYLSFVQGYRDEDGKVKQKTIEKLPSFAVTQFFNTNQSLLV